MATLSRLGFASHPFFPAHHPGKFRVCGVQQKTSVKVLELSYLLLLSHLFLLLYTPYICRSLPSDAFYLFIYLFFKNLFYLFIYFWHHWVFIAVRGLSLVVASGVYSSLQCAGFSLRWLLLWSTGSRRVGFSSCGTQAQ